MKMQTRTVFRLVLALCIVGAVLSKSVRNAEEYGDLTNVKNTEVTGDMMQEIRQRRDDSVSDSEESESVESESEESETEESESEESESAESESEESESAESESEESETEESESEESESEERR